jgi:hypothetical protein
MLIDIRDASLSAPRPKPSAAAGSATDELLQMFRVPGSLHRDPGDGTVDVADIVGREFHRRRVDILLQAMQFCGAGDRNDPRLPSQQPGDRDLGRRRLLLRSMLPSRSTTAWFAFRAGAKRGTMLRKSAEAILGPP